MDSNFTFTGDFNGPAVAAVLSLMTLAALIANITVLSITLYQRKSWKQSSTIFFTSLILAHLVMDILHLPFTIIALAAGGWIFGSTDEEKRGTCSFAAFISEYTVTVVAVTLGAISFDRFLFIVKPHLHKRFMRPWVALTLTITIWILASFFYSTTFFGVGEVIYDNEYGSCLRDYSNSIIGRVLFTVLIPITITAVIIVMSTWTFCFTRSYFNDHSVIGGESVYATKKMRLFGIFGSMLLVYGICFFPGLLRFILLIFISVPSWFSITSFVCLVFITVASPIVQSYFRPEIKGAFHSLCPLLTTCVCCSCNHDTC